MSLHLRETWVNQWKLPREIIALDVPVTAQNFTRQSKAFFFLWHFLFMEVAEISQSVLAD
jgi:hypothetical protein